MKTNRKSYMSYRMALILMTLSDPECHFSCFWTFLTPIHQRIWQVLTTLCVYVDEKVSVIFNRNCFPKNERRFNVRPPTGSHVHRKTGNMKKWREIGTLLLHTTNRNYYRAYQFVPFPMTLDDLEGHSPNAGLTKCNSTNICATFSTVLTARRVVPRDNWASTFASNMANLVSILCLQTVCHWAWLKVQIYQQHINIIYSNRCWMFTSTEGFPLVISISKWLTIEFGTLKFSKICRIRRTVLQW